ncbi:MAG: hypothetical protein FJ271_31625 [Planctomycetes bacterium]|nr:hypothetical protein [Planctomycetota bacterium]
MTFSVRQSCFLASLSFATADRWVSRWLSPVAGGIWKGNDRALSVGQCFALHVGSAYRREGADQDRVRGIVSFLGTVPVERLEAELEAGRSWPCPAGLIGAAPRPSAWLPGLFTAPPSTTGCRPGVALLVHRLDLGVLYREFRERIETMPVQRRRGRPRRREGASVVS